MPLETAPYTLTIIALAVFGLSLTNVGTRPPLVYIAWVVISGALLILCSLHMAYGIDNPVGVPGDSLHVHYGLRAAVSLIISLGVLIVVPQAMPPPTPPPSPRPEPEEVDQAG